MIAAALATVGISQAAARRIGFVVLAAIVAALTVWVMHLREQAQAYEVLHAEHTALETRYGCPDREPIERDLARCLLARDLAVAEAQRDEIGRQRAEAAREQAALDKAQAQADAKARAMDSFIDQSAVTADGPVPKVLLDTWDQERKERGLK